MTGVWTWIRNEPAVVGSIIVAILNVFGYSLTTEGATALETLVETWPGTIAILAGGGVVRQKVTPVAKLKGKTGDSR